MPEDALNEILVHLVGLGLVPRDTECVSLRGGRSNHVWRLSGTPALVLKVFRQHNDNPLFANDARLEELAMKHLSGLGLAPAFLGSGRFRHRNWILYQHVPGSPWADRVSDAADLLGRLHVQNPFPGLPVGPNGSDSLVAQANKILLATNQGARGWLGDLRPSGFVPPSPDRAFIHGDPVPGNLVVQGQNVTLIDWQCPSFGDPAEDLALFVSPAMQYLYRGRPLDAEQTAQFLAAYPDKKVTNRFRLLVRWFHWRMAAYCLWKTEQGNPDYEVGLELELDALHRQTT